MIRQYDVAYFMISVDSLEDNTAFAQKEDADFPILADPTRETARKYGVPTPPERFWRTWDRFGGGVPPGSPAQNGEFINRELYETTTGAAAVAESLQLRRMNLVGASIDEKRTVPIAQVRGIDTGAPGTPLGE